MHLGEMGFRFPIPRSASTSPSRSAASRPPSSDDAGQSRQLPAASPQVCLESQCGFTPAAELQLARFHDDDAVNATVGLPTSLIELHEEVATWPLKTGP